MMSCIPNQLSIIKENLMKVIKVLHVGILCMLLE